MAGTYLGTVERPGDRLDRLAGQDARLEPGCLLGGLHPELHHEGATALQELSQRMAGPPAAGVGEHQLAVSLLVERVDLEQLAPGADRPVPLPGLDVDLDQCPEHLGVGLDKTLTPGERPFRVAVDWEWLAQPELG